ncbi:FAD:protein FMN transferase [Shinella sp. S4-D37]|uniref:FAD:protein FMN transferase n=1 Tax=Shinella sp. S4-D37 TaxID=3161999 RepID=UPI00346694FF
MHVKSEPLGRRRFLALGGAALLLGTAPAQAREAAPVKVLSGAAFATGWRVALRDDANISGLQARLANTLHTIDLAFSPWRSDSMIGRFNRSHADEAVVSDAVVGVARSALGIAEASGGRFDPTVGPMVARWGFGPIEKGETLPDGWRKIRAGNGHVARTARGLTLDFCGIAKGYALDRMAADLLDAGHEDFLVDLGGELAARGRHPSGRAWHVGIENPLPDAEGLNGVLQLDGMAVATSGDRRNGYDVGGRRYSHIIDPSTLEPVAGAPASVSVLMPAALDADGWATALMAAGSAGPDLARARDIAALFLFRHRDALRSVATGAFTRYLV